LDGRITLHTEKIEHTQTLSLSLDIGESACYTDPMERSIKMTRSAVLAVLLLVDGLGSVHNRDYQNYFFADGEWVKKKYGR